MKKLYEETVRHYETIAVMKGRPKAYYFREGDLPNPPSVEIEMKNAGRGSIFVSKSSHPISLWKAIRKYGLVKVFRCLVS